MSEASLGATAAQSPVGTIPESEWVWCGYAGHLVVASDCRFHLCTRVGDYRISTVGDYRPAYKGGEMHTIGSGDSYFETYVFHVAGEGVHGEGAVTDWGEIDSRRYGKDAATTGEVERGHFAFCRKYAQSPPHPEREEAGG